MLTSAFLPLAPTFSLCLSWVRHERSLTGPCIWTVGIQQTLMALYGGNCPSFRRWSPSGGSKSLEAGLGESVSLEAGLGESVSLEVGLGGSVSLDILGSPAQKGQSQPHHQTPTSKPKASRCQNWTPNKLLFLSCFLSQSHSWEK